jgi:heptosyltransferase II
MKILIVLPNWLGDAVMATPAIEVLSTLYPDANFTFVGSAVSIGALKSHPRCENAFVDETKKNGNRLLNTYKFAKKLGKFHMAVSFRSQLHATLLVKWVDTPIRLLRSSWHAALLLGHSAHISRSQHLSLQYLKIATANLQNSPNDAPPPKLYTQKHVFEKPTLGINAGATYGSAKRWVPKRFAEVAAHLSNRFDIVIFGGAGETQTAKEIAEELSHLHVSNFLNLAGKTSIEELCAYIGGCSLFITNDSGPMHIAAAYQVPTVAIFGSTRHEETSQWKNKKSIIVRHDMECAPCMKRECPLKHHECMLSITASEVIQAAKSLL